MAAGIGCRRRLGAKAKVHRSSSPPSARNSPIPHCGPARYRPRMKTARPTLRSPCPRISPLGNALWGMGHGTRVGEGAGEVITRKRSDGADAGAAIFRREGRSRASANVHNYLKSAKQVISVRIGTRRQSFGGVDRCQAVKSRSRPAARARRLARQSGAKARPSCA